MQISIVSPRTTDRELGKVVDSAIPTFSKREKKAAVKQIAHGKVFLNQVVDGLLESRLPSEVVAEASVNLFSNYFDLEGKKDRLVEAASQRAQAFANRWIEHLLGNHPLAQIAKQASAYVLTGDNIEAIVEGALDDLLGRAQSIIANSLFSAQRWLARAISTEVAEDGRALLWYAGPEDLKTRPFCRVFAGYVVYEDEFSKTRNGHGLPVLEHCGGWNCRHSLIPVSKAIMETYNLVLAPSSSYAEATAAASRR